MAGVWSRLGQLLLVLSLLSGISALPSFAWSPADTSYSAYILVNVSVSPASNNYQIPFNISKQPEMQSDYDDVNITSVTGAEIPIFLVDSTANYALYWIKGDFNVSGTYVYVLYGNDLATSRSNMSAVADASDDFNDASIPASYKCEALASGRGYSEAGGYLNWSTDNTAGNNYCYGMLGYGANAFQNGTIIMKYYLKPITSDGIFLQIQPRFDAEADRWMAGARQPNSAYRVYQASTQVNTFNIKPPNATWLIDYFKLDGSNISYAVNGTYVMINTSTSSPDAGNLTLFVSSNYDKSSYVLFDWISVMRANVFTQPEPAITFGSPQSIAHSVIISETGTPYVDNEIIFLVTKLGEVISNSWWNFTDGNSSYYVAGNTTKHTFLSSGLFNVSVIATNSSGLNETDYYELNIYETQVKFALKNVITNTFLSDWTLYLSNSTDSEVFSVSNNQTINYTTLKGFVSVIPTKAEYNTTASNFTQNSTSNQTIILNATPSIVIVNVFDYLFPTATLPFKVTYSNESKSVIHSYSGWTNSSIYSESDTLLYVEETFASELGQIFKYNFSTAGTEDATEWDNENFTAQLCSVDDICYPIEYNDNWNPASHYVTLSHIVYLDKDGTFTIRELDGTISDTGTFPFFPAYLKVTAYAEDASDDADLNVVYMGLATDLQTYDSAYPTEIKGNITVVVEQDTSGIYGYLDNLYRSNRFFVQNQGYTVHNLTSYLIGTSEGYSVRYSVYDVSSTVVSNAIVKIYKLINETFEEIGSAKTDGTGSTPYFWVSPDENLWVIATKGVDSSGLQNVVVSQTAYDVRLQFGLQNEYLPSFFEGVDLSFSPAGSTVYDNSTTNFSMYLVDPDSYLINVTAVLNSSQYEFDYDFSSTDDSVALFYQELNLTELSGYAGDLSFYYEIYRENSAGELERLQGVNSWDVVSSENLISQLSGLDLGGFKSLFSVVILAGAVVTSTWIAIFAGVILGLIGFITWDIVLISVVLAVMARMREASE